jgi:5-formyltetrahydrofolate cyclo-ligase
MLKKDLRIKYKNLRKLITKEDLEVQSLAIANQLLKLPIWDKNYYHVFMPIVELNEVNTDYIIQILAGKDKDIVVSKSDFENLKMISYLLNDEVKFQKNKYNIFEPVTGKSIENSKIQVVFLPLLAYDLKGNRVGYGKGFYDNFLTECDKNVIKVGLSFYEPENEIEDVTINDIQLDYCVTPTKINSFL